MKFELNKKEIENLQKYVEALDFLLDGATEIKRTFHFTETGIGVICKVTLVGINSETNKNITVEKDITDYESW